MECKRLKMVISKLRGLTPDRITAFSGAVMALATLILVGVTWQYVRLTNRLVRLQIEPSVEAGLDQPFIGSTTFTVQNAGAEPVENVIVNIRCFLFRGPNDRQPMVFFAGLPSDNKRSWWQIGKLRPGEIVKKDSTEHLTTFLTNKEKQENFENERAKAQAKDGKFQPLILGSIVAFDLSYQRQVDHKSYHMSRPAWLYKDGNTGKPVLVVRVISPEYKDLLEELTSGGGKRP
jgi:hypothetical protein